MSSIEEILNRDGRLIYKTRGVSMLPMLHQNQDLVVITVPQARLKKYDVALYKRGTDYVLHRVLYVKENEYIIRGDNTYHLEHVPDRAVIGVLTGFVRKGKQYSVTDGRYKCYVRFWHAIYPLRAAWVQAKRMLRAAARRIIK